MSGEYLIFDLAIFGMPLLGLLRPVHRLRPQYVPALIACLIVAIPYVAWDALVAGRHWDFNANYVLGPRFLGLPFEEVLFFISVPFACLSAWTLLRTSDARPESRALRFTYPLMFAALPLGIWALWTGKEYSGLVLLALSSVALLDRLLETKLALRPHFWSFMLLVVGLTAFFNGYLTSRPIVTYDEQFQLGIRLGTIPLEDFGYGLSLVYSALIVFDRLTDKKSPWVDRIVRGRLGGYRHQANLVDSTLPDNFEVAPRVAVVGSGLAGLTAASYLAERGARVVVYEKETYLGGKVGAWPVELTNGEVVSAEHGFHAFFRHYFNLNRFLKRTGADGCLRPIDDYLIKAVDGAEYSFRRVATTPVMNLISLAWNGVYRLGSVITSGAGPKLRAFLEYDREKTFAEYDEITFDEWSRTAKLPKSLELVFTTFARAFFADRTKISMAELIKSFHFYYLSNDAGLLYDYLIDDYEVAMISPIRSHLEAHGGEFRLGAGVRSIERESDGFTVDGEHFDKVVMATNVPGVRALLAASDTLSAAPELSAKIGKLRAGQRYAVLRLWLSRECGQGWPIFSITERRRIVDSVSFIHRAEKKSAEWAKKADGRSVVELHCYAVPDELSDSQVRAVLLDDLARYCPDFDPSSILGEDLQLNQNMSAFHVGMWKHRPTHETEVEGLYLAGDWVKLPYPAMLMEAASMSGLLCANAILSESGLREEPVYRVPLRGLLADHRQPAA